jgi:DNA repair protein RadC
MQFKSADREYEVLVAQFLDSQHPLIAAEELFRRVGISSFPRARMSGFFTQFCASLQSEI